MCKRLDRQLHLGILENKKEDCDLQPLARAKQRMFGDGCMNIVCVYYIDEYLQIQERYIIFDEWKNG